MSIDQVAGGQVESSSLVRKTMVGSVWLGGSTMLLKLANIAVTAVIARIVAPAEFGVFSIAMIVFTIVSGCAELGVGSAIGRRDLKLSSIAPSVATIALGSSAILTVGMALFATPIATALGSAQASDSVRILSLAVMLTGVFAVPGGQLQRDFRQKAVSIANGVSMVVGSGTMIGLAFVTSGADAFAWSRVIAQSCAGLVMIAQLDRHFAPGWNSKVVPALLKFGLPLAAANTLSLVIVNVDNVFVGHLLGVVALGFYSIAFNVSSWANTVLSSVLNGMVLPTISAVRAAQGDLRQAVHQAVQLVGLVSAPISAATSALAFPLIGSVYGARWLEAAPVLMVLSGFGFVSVVCLLFAGVIIAGGRTSELMLVQVAACVALIPAIYFGIRWFGLVGVGYAHLAVCLAVTAPCYIVVLRRSTGVGFARIARALAWPVGAAVAAGAVGWLVSSLLEHPLTQLIVGGLSGALTYAVIVFPLGLRMYRNYTSRARSERLDEPYLPAEEQLNA